MIRALPKRYVFSALVIKLVSPILSTIRYRDVIIAVVINTYPKYCGLYFSLIPSIPIIPNPKKGRYLSMTAL